MKQTALVIRHVPFEDLGILAPVLRERSVEIHYLDAGIDPVDIADVMSADLLVVLGGPIGVGDLDSYPFLSDELRAIRPRLDHHLPTLGICLGAQLIATALGAEVKPTGRVEIGFSPLELTEDGNDSVLSVIGAVPVLHWHSDAFAIPHGTTRLAETTGFPNQAFSYGPNILALQPHLEADHTQIERWLIGHAHELSSNRIGINQIRRDALEHGPKLAQAGRDVFGRWLDQIEYSAIA